MEPFPPAKVPASGSEKSAASAKPQPATPPAPGVTQENFEATVVPNPAAHDPEATQVESQVPVGTRPPKAAGETKKITQLGDFKLVKKLGQGGMGEVFLAQQISLDRPVALKVMAKQFSSQEAFVKRFKREAQSMAKLDHPHIVRGYAVGEDQGLLFLAMELVKGKSLQDWMNELGKLPVGDALHVALIVADALKHAHEINLIHRDIKPDNILVTEKGIVKVSDMGLAKATDEDMSMTQSGTGLGTPYYMPPEQARNAKYVDHRCDIYALGGTLYYFLTGKLPYSGDSAMELIMAKEKGTFTRVRQLNPAIPERLDLMIDKMLAKDPKHRYQTCDELIRDLSSLHLENAALSFIPNGESSAATSKMPRVPAPAAPVPTAHSGAAAGAQEDHVWHVLTFGADGKPRKVKMTTGQIKQQFKTGQLDVRTKAAASAQGNYLPLASFREFEQVAKGRVIKEEAEKKGEKFKKLYQDIDRQERWYRWTKGIRRLLQDAKGVLSLVIYLAILGAIGFGLYLYGPKVLELIKARTGG